MKKVFKDTPYTERLTESQLEPFQTQEKILSLERLYDAAKKKNWVQSLLIFPKPD